MKNIILIFIILLICSCNKSTFQAKGEDGANFYATKPSEFILEEGELVCIYNKDSLFNAFWELDLNGNMLDTSFVKDGLLFTYKMVNVDYIR